MVIAARSLRHEELPFDSSIMSPASVSRANPLDLDFLGIFMDGGRDGHAGRAYMNLPNEIKAQISFDALFPGPRDIRVIWSRTEKRWSYLSLLKPNKAPFVVKGFAGAMKHYCNHSLKPAPTLSSEPPYKWFNYDTDTLVFDYTHCGSDEAEIDNFEVAMKTAVRMLCRSRNANPYQRELKKLQITYCAQLYNNEGPSRFLPWLEKIKGLKKVILRAHDHYEAERNDGVSERDWYHIDFFYMDMSAEDDDLLCYPFKVELYAACGTYIGPNMSPITSKTAMTTLKAGEVFERF